jgi:hypothetical protein
VPGGWDWGDEPTDPEIRLAAANSARLHDRVVEMLEPSLRLDAPFVLTVEAICQLHAIAMAGPLAVRGRSLGCLLGLAQATGDTVDDVGRVVWIGRITRRHGLHHGVAPITTFILVGAQACEAVHGALVLED